MAAMYVDDTTDAIERLNLWETEISTNVLSLDPIAFERKNHSVGLYFVVPSQLAVDLLNESGREPVQQKQTPAWKEMN